MDKPPAGHLEHSPINDALRRAGQLMILLERHLDRAAEAGIDEMARAWVRASQLEQLLRGLLPPGTTDSIDVNDPDSETAPPRPAAPDAPAAGAPPRDAPAT